MGTGLQFISSRLALRSHSLVSGSRVIVGETDRDAGGGSTGVRATRTRVSPRERCARRQHTMAVLLLTEECAKCLAPAYTFLWDASCFLI